MTTREQRADRNQIMIDMYDGGASIRAIAGKFNLSTVRIREIVCSGLFIPAERKKTVFNENELDAATCAIVNAERFNPENWHKIN